MFDQSLPFSDFTDFFLASILLVAYRYERRFLVISALSAFTITESSTRAALARLARRLDKLDGPAED